MRGSLLLHRRVAGEARDTRELSVCVYVLTASEKSNCARVCHFYKLLRYIPMSDVCRGQPGVTRGRAIFSLSPYTASFMVMPQVTALNLTTAALKESIKAAALSTALRYFYFI